VNAVGATAVLALVGLVLAIAALNVTILLVARVSFRQAELAVRSALGADRWRLVRPLTIEILLVTAAGGLLGLFVGVWAARLLPGVLRVPGDLPVRFSFEADWRVVAYAAAAVLAACLVMSLVTAGHAVRAAAAVPHQSSRSSSGHRSRTRRRLVIAQVAGCVVLLVVAGLFVRSLQAATRADLGFDPRGVLNVHMDVGQLGYADPRGREFFDQVMRGVESLPGVRAASYAVTVPLGYIRLGEMIIAESQDDADSVRAGTNSISPEYFDVMGIRLTRGRAFTKDDAAGARPVAVVNERLAAALWPGDDAVGRRLRTTAPGAEWMEIVGVVETGTYAYLFEEPQPFLYRPIAQAHSDLRVLQVRADLAPTELAPAIGGLIHEIEPDLPLYDVQPMTEALGGGLGLFPVRVGAVAAAVLGIAGLLLAAVGVYGVVSYLTVQRRPELGIRLAIGAAPSDVVELVLRDGLTLVAIGVGVGLAAAGLCSRLLNGLLFGVSASDLVTYLAVTVLLLGVGLLASVLPAWQASRLDPKAVLRTDCSGH
jgi:predicted permease